MENQNSIPQGHNVTVPAPAQQVAPNSQPVYSTTPAVTTTPAQKSSWLLWCLGCAGLLLVLVICCVCSFSIWLPTVIQNSNINQDFNRSEFQSLSPAEIPSGNTTESDLQKRFNDTRRQNPNGQLTLSFSEKDLLKHLVGTSTQNEGLAEGLFLKFDDNNRASLRIELSKLVESLDNQTQVNPQDLQDLYIAVDVKVANDSKTLEVTNVSTGNSFIDSFISESLKVALQDELNNALNNVGGTSTYQVQKIEIKKGQMSITFAPAR